VRNFLTYLEDRRALFREAMDTTTAGGELLFHVMGALAQFERRLNVERSRAGIAAARKRGKHLGATDGSSLRRKFGTPAYDRQRGTIGFRHGEAASRSNSDDSIPSTFRNRPKFLAYARTQALI
jgi:hypothetical protein